MSDNVYVLCRGWGSKSEWLCFESRRDALDYAEASIAFDGGEYGNKWFDCDGYQVCDDDAAELFSVPKPSRDYRLALVYTGKYELVEDDGAYQSYRHIDYIIPDSKRTVPVKNKHYTLDQWNGWIVYYRSRSADLWHAIGVSPTLSAAKNSQARGLVWEDRNSHVSHASGSLSGYYMITNVTVPVTLMRFLTNKELLMLDDGIQDVFHEVQNGAGL